MGMFCLIDNISDISAIMSTISSIAALIVAIVVASMQNKQEKRAQKISLWEKRYGIFEEFSTLYGFSQFALDLESKEKWQRTSAENYLVVAEAVIEQFGLLKDKRFISERIRLNRLVREGGEEGHLADIELMNLDMHANERLMHLKKQLFKTITSAKFCFNSEISDVMKEYVDVLFDYIEIFKNGSALENHRDISSLKEVVLKLEKNKIFIKMERFLTI